ncbi:MAG: hypothetical protein AB7L71_02420 [Vicinamibacterales bacterium]
MNSVFDNAQSFVASRPLVQFRLRFREEQGVPFLVSEPDEGAGAVGLVCVSRQQDKAVAAVVCLSAARPSPDFVARADALVDGWSSMLALIMNIEVRHLQFAALNIRGEGFYALEIHGERHWVALDELTPSCDVPWAQLRLVFPDYGSLLKRLALELDAAGADCTRLAPLDAAATAS